MNPMETTALGFFYEDPAAAASAELEGLEDLLNLYYGPYKDAGLRSLSSLEEQYNLLISNPGGVYSGLSSGFESSPGYEYQYNEAMNAQNSAAAAGGMLGTPSHYTQSAQVATDMANQDYYNYMDEMIKMYNMGLGGLSDLNQMGYNASHEIASTLSHMMGVEAAMAAKSAQSSNSAWGDMMGATMGMIGL